MTRLFGTDGVRGVANKDLSPELALAVGRGAAEFFRAGTGKRPKIFVGIDTRVSSDMIEAALCAGLCSGGADVLRLSAITTPAVAYLTRANGADGGAVISASHNPFEYNGIKFFSREGYKLSDDAEDKIEHLSRTSSARPAITGSGIGRVEADPELVDQYIDYLIREASRSFRGLRLVIDCANGSASAISPRTFRRLGAEVFPVHNKPDGVNINVGCGSTEVESLRKAVVAQKADAGLAHDGDGDRLIAVDETGAVLDGDYIMAICGLQMLRKGTLHDRTVVATIMSNIGLDIAFRKASGRVVKTRVGDRYVLEQMRREGYKLGGEQSGHIVFTDSSTTGDGILTGIKLLDVMKDTGMPLSRLARQMERLPQVLLNVRVGQAARYEANPRIAIAIEDAEEELGDRGRVVVRPSGTEPMIRIMVEAEREDKANEVAKRLAEAIRKELE
jgi:phosphoglucosamine mutase